MSLFGGLDWAKAKHAISLLKSHSTCAPGTARNPAYVLREGVKEHRSESRGDDISG